MAAGLTCGDRRLRVTCADGGTVQGNAVVVATGAAYRKLTVPELGRFEGNGVYYGATRVEAQLCERRGDRGGRRGQLGRAGRGVPVR